MADLYDFLMAERTFWKFGYWWIELIAVYDQRTSPFEYYWFSCHTCHVSTIQIHVNMQTLRFRSKWEDYEILNYCFLIVSSSNQTTMAHVIVTHYCSYSCRYTTNQCLCLHYSIPVFHDYCLKTHLLIFWNMLFLYI